MCKECKEEKVRKCNTCNLTLEEDKYFQKGGKDENGNQKYKGRCRICEWKRSHKDLELDENDLVLIKIFLTDLSDIKSINDLLKYVKDISLKELCYKVSYKLKLKSNNLDVNIQCDNCKTSINIKTSEYYNSHNHYCSKECSNRGRVGKNFNKVIKQSNCAECGDLFDVKSNVKNQRFCSNACKSKYYTKLPKNKVDVECAYCNKKYKTFKTNTKRSKNNFCSVECQNKWIHEQTHEIRKCEICGKDFECSKTSTQKFCDIVCQGKWQSTQIGEINPRFTSEKVKCDWCGKEHYKTQYDIKNKHSYFCCEKCYRKWMANVWSQTDEVKNATRIRAVKMLETGKFNHTNTKCQNIINDLLNKLGIKYINEKNIDNYYCVDNYLTDYNLIIEVMGDFWHCNPTKYKVINYDMQYKRIIKDKAKYTHIKNNKNIDILYLWENDIYNNLELCESMIKDFIRRELYEFHSFNYRKDNRIIPYQEYLPNKLNDILDLSVKEKICKKDESKWITFNCEHCGKECEELISHYNTKKTHCCSRECSHKLQSVDSIEVKCENCNQVFNVKPYVYKLNKSKQFCCSKNCRTEYLKKRKRVVFNCDYCGKENSKTLSNYNKSKNNHFCDLTCMQNYNESKKSI